MKQARMSAGLGLGLALTCTPAYAQDLDAEVTMRLVPNVDDLPEVIRQTLALPEPASLEASQAAPQLLSCSCSFTTSGLTMATIGRAARNGA